ncbi:MAG: YlbF family regulator [Chloroflexi bacterium]|nr:YlbF family regulator [Chloroflexota bacterium]
MDKVDLKTGNYLLSKIILEATTELAEKIVNSEPFTYLKNSEAKLNADAQALHLINDITELQEKIRSQNQTNIIPESEFTRYRELQNEIGANEVIQESGMAQENAIAFLREVNQEISNLLGVDFASLIRRSSGCC